MRTAHDALPRLFFGLVKYTTKKKHVAFPNLFDSYVTNQLFEAALLRPTYFPNSEVSLPAFPAASEKEYPNTIAALLRAVKNVSQPVPTHLRIYGEPIPPALLDQLVGLADPDRSAAPLQPIVEQDTGDLPAFASAGPIP